MSKQTQSELLQSLGCDDFAEFVRRSNARYTLISIDEAARQSNNSVNNYRRLAAAGLLPRPIKVGKKKIAIVQEELNEAIARQIQQRDCEQTAA